MSASLVIRHVPLCTTRVLRMQMWWVTAAGGRGGGHRKEECERADE